MRHKTRHLTQSERGRRLSGWCVIAELQGGTLNRKLCDLIFRAQGHVGCSVKADGVMGVPYGYWEHVGGLDSGQEEVAASRKKVVVARVGGEVGSFELYLGGAGGSVDA